MKIIPSNCQQPPKPARKHVLFLKIGWLEMQKCVTVLGVHEVSALFPGALWDPAYDVAVSDFFFGLTDYDTLVYWTGWNTIVKLIPNVYEGDCWDLKTWHNNEWLDGIWLPETDDTPAYD
jgi:hypothetical protein